MLTLFSKESLSTCPLDHGEGPQAWPGRGFILDTAGSSSWAYNLNSITHSAPPVTINSFITSSRPLTPFNAFSGIILGTDVTTLYYSPIYTKAPEADLKTVIRFSSYFIFLYCLFSSF